jgi:glycine/D-amino acid oxidase-like deaminating enzyme
MFIGGESFWQTTATPFESVDLHLPRRVDVAIIGGGYTGLSAARALAQRGARVAVLEAKQVGWGASSRNGGQVLTGMKKGVGALTAHYGLEQTQRWFAMSLQAIDLVEQIVRDERIACDFVRSGHLEAAAKPSHYAAFEHEAERLERDFNHKVQVLSRADMPNELNSPRYHGVLVDELSAGLNPARYVHGLAQAAQRAGAQIFEQTRVEQLRREGEGFLLKTSLGSLLADHVLAATNGYTDNALPTIRRRVIPVGSYIVATEQLPDTVARDLIPKGRMVFDTKNFLYYFRLTADNRLIFGGRATFSPPDQHTLPRSAQALSKGMLEVFPQLKRTRVEYSWGGTLGFTFDIMPHAGELNGIHYALGYAGHGVAIATYLGTQMAAVISGERGANPFASMRFPRAPLGLYNGNPWFMPFAGLWYRFLDLVS